MPNAEGPGRPAVPPPMALLWLLLIILATYGSVLNGHFMGEDHLWLSSARDRWQPLWKVVTDSGFGQWTPLFNLLIALGYRTVGLRAAPFNAVLLAAHLLNVALFFTLLGRWGVSLAARTFAAAVFGVAVQGDQAVIWIAGGNHVLVVSFLLLLLLAANGWAESGHPGALAGAAAAYAAGLLCKEVGLLGLPLVLATGWLRAWERRRLLVLTGLLGLLVLLYLPAKFGLISSAGFVEAGMWVRGPGEYLRNLPYQLWYATHPPATHGLLGIAYAVEPPAWALLAITVLGWLLAVAGLALARQRQLFALGAVTMVILAAPYAIWHGEALPPAASRFTYPATLGWAMLLGSGLAAWLERGRRWRALAGAAAASYLLFQIWATSADVTSWAGIARARLMVLTAVQRAVPDPPAGAVLVIHGLKPHLFDPLNSLALYYGRAVAAVPAGGTVASGSSGPVIHLHWDGRREMTVRASPD